MNTNVTRFCGNVAAPVLRDVRANSFNANRQLDVRSVTQSRQPVRAVRIVVWRKNQASGRLECRSTTERSTATDEGVSCNDLLRQAA
jgi:hypothetical protein